MKLDTPAIVADWTASTAAWRDSSAAIGQLNAALVELQQLAPADAAELVGGPAGARALLAVIDPLIVAGGEAIEQLKQARRLLSAQAALDAKSDLRRKPPFLRRKRG